MAKIMNVDIHRLAKRPGRDDGKSTDRSPQVYLVVIEESRLADAVATELRTHLALPRQHVLAVVPPFRGRGYTAPCYQQWAERWQGAHLPPGSHPLLVTLGQDGLLDDLERLVLPAYVAVPPDRPGATLCGRDGVRIVLIPATTARQFVRAILDRSVPPGAPLAARTPARSPREVARIRAPSGESPRLVSAGISGVATAAVLAACMSAGSPTAHFRPVPPPPQWRAVESPVHLVAAERPVQGATPPGPGQSGSSPGAGQAQSAGHLGTAGNGLASAWNTLQDAVSSAWDSLPNGMGFGISFINYADGSLQVWLGKDASGDPTLSFGGGPGVGPGRGRLTPAYEEQPAYGFQADAGVNTRNGVPNAYLIGGIDSNGPHAEAEPGHSPVGRLPVTWNGSGSHGGVNGPSLSGRSTTPQWWPFAWGSGITSINLRTGAISGGPAGLAGVGGFFAWKAAKNGLKSLAEREAPWRPTPSPPEWQDPWGPVPEPQPAFPGSEIPNNRYIDPYVNNEYGPTVEEPPTQEMSAEESPAQEPLAQGQPEEPPALGPPEEPLSQGPAEEPPVAEAPDNPNVDPVIDTPGGIQNPDAPTGTYDPPGDPQPPPQPPPPAPVQPSAGPSSTDGQPPPDPWYSPGNLVSDAENAWSAINGAAGDAQSALQNADDWLAQNDGWAWMQQQPFVQDLGTYGVGPDANAPGGKFGPDPDSPGGAPDAPDIPIVPEAYSAPLNSGSGGVTSPAGGYVASTPLSASSSTVTALGAGSGSAAGGGAGSPSA